MARRGNNEGSVYRSVNGWMAQLSVRQGDGSRKLVRRRARTKALAQGLLREMQAEYARIGDVANAQRTVAVATDAWMKMRRARTLEPGTLDNDEWAVKLIVSGLGRRRVARLSVRDCDGFLQAVADGELGEAIGRAQVRRVRQKLIGVIENEARMGYASRNVARLSVLPEISSTDGRRKARAIPAAQIQSLVEHGLGAAAVLIDLSGRNGLRPAEARALRWKGVDLEARRIRIDRQMNRRNELAPVKTARALRTIRIDRRTAALMREWRDDQLQAAKDAGPAWSGNPLDLVATTRLGTPINQRNVHRSMTDASKRAGIEPAVSGYDLRHSAITLMIENGHPVYRVADWAGTSERMIWDVYRHLLDDVTDLGSIDDGDDRS
jgi:integrase